MEDTSVILSRLAGEFSQQNNRALPVGEEEVFEVEETESNESGGSKMVCRRVNGPQSLLVGCKRQDGGCQVGG